MEQIFKILHTPTGLYVKDCYISISMCKKDYPGYLAYINKKGRSWKRYCDILIAWQTIKKGLREKNVPNLINDYAVEIFELTLVERPSIDDLENDIHIKNVKYQKRQLEQEKSRLQFRLQEFKNGMNNTKELIPKIEEELKKINIKLEKHGK